MAEDLALLGEVANLAWQYREELAGGARGLWKFVTGHGRAKGHSAGAPAILSQMEAARKSAAHSKPVVKGGKGGGISAHGPSGSRAGYAAQTVRNSLAESFKEINPTYWQTTPISHTKYGEGVRALGRQFLAIGQPLETGVGTQTFGVFDSANQNADAVSDTCRCYVQPSWLGWRLGAMAPFYDLFAFRHFRLIYVPGCATTQTGSFTICYISDPAIVARAAITDISYREVVECVPSAMSPFREHVALEFNYSGDALFYCDVADVNVPTTSDPIDLRQCTQGAFVGMTIGNDAAVYGQANGQWMIEYVVDFHKQAIDFGEVALDWLPSRTERLLVSNFLRSLRAGRDSSPRALLGQLHDNWVAKTSAETLQKTPGGPAPSEDLQCRLMQPTVPPPAIVGPRSLVPTRATAEDFVILGVPAPNHGAVSTQMSVDRPRSLGFAKR